MDRQPRAKASAPWQHIDSVGLPDRGYVTVTWQRWCAEQTEILQWRDSKAERALGVRISTAVEIDRVGFIASEFALIVVVVEAFSDGRMFSLGRMLRRRFGYRGALWAMGDVLPDQDAFLQRCGFDLVVRNNGVVVPQSIPGFARHYQREESSAQRQGSIRDMRRAAQIGETVAVPSHAGSPKPNLQNQPTAVAVQPDTKT